MVGHNNQGSIEWFEIQCERLFEQVVEFEKLKIGDKFSIVEKKEDEGESINIKDGIVGKDTQKFQLWGDLDIQPNIPQQNISQMFFRPKTGKKEKIDEVLDVIYALFIVVHLKRIWKQHHLFFKFMEFLTNKRMMSSLYHICHLNGGWYVKLMTLKKRFVGGNPRQ